GLPANVTAATDVTLSVGTGAGAVGGTVSGTIAAGTNSVTVSGVTYTNPAGETGVTLVATRTAGDTLTAGTSAGFTVIGTATQIAFVQQPTTVVRGSSISPAVTVEVRDAAGSRVTSNN